MPSLFDFSDPRNAGLMGLSAGLLQAGGPSPFPRSLGQGLGTGLMQATEMQLAAMQAQRRSDFINAQTQHLATQDAATRASIDRARQQSTALQAFFGQSETDPAQTALTRGAAVGDVGPTVSNAQRMGVAQAAVPNFEALIAAGIDPAVVRAAQESYKLRNPEAQWQGGIPMHPRTAQPMTGGTVVPQTNQQGFSTTPRFNPMTRQFEVGVTPGSEQAFARQQGIQARFAEPVTIQPPGGGPAQVMTREAFGNMNAPGPQVPQRSPATAPAAAPPGRAVQSAGQLAAQKAVDEAFAKDMVAYSQGGGADATKQLAQLKDVQTALETEGANLTGPLIGSTPDAVLKVTNPGAIAMRERVEEVVQRSLRSILGAQFTEREGERLIARAYNPNLSEKENATRVGRLLTQLTAAAQSKQEAIQHFQQRGTLAGWQGKLPKISDFSPDQTGTEGKVRRYNPATGRIE